MIPVVDIRKLYKLYLKEQEIRGVCMGFCLTWLGDILKERPELKPRRWLSRRGKSSLKQPVTPAEKAILPSDSFRMILLLDRAYRKQKHYFERYERHKAEGGARLSYDDVTINYKNDLQREKQAITGFPGLEYRAHARSHFLQYKVLNDYDNKDNISGVIITFTFNHASGRKGNHAVAAFRVSECETFFLDPNHGLFKTNSQNPMLKINSYLERRYRNAIPNTELSVTRRLRGN